jgi:Rrf2 family protein
MSGVIHISEAASLALHTMIFLAGRADRAVSAKEVAAELAVSVNHLLKVLQRLVKARLLVSIRGPRGGFRLKDHPRRVRLLHVFEAMEGALQPKRCLLGRPRCGGDCVLGDFMVDATGQFRRLLSETTLSDVAGTFRGRSA